MSETRPTPSVAAADAPWPGDCVERERNRYRRTEACTVAGDGMPKNKELKRVSPRGSAISMPSGTFSFRSASDPRPIWSKSFV